MTQTIRILLVDDHPMVRRGLAMLINECEDFLLVGEAEDGEMATVLYEQMRPDVVLMDLMLPKLDGISATRMIRAINPQAHIITMTSFENEELVRDALQAGATGFVYKNIPASELITAIRMTSEGKPILDPKALQTLISLTSKAKEISSTKANTHDLTHRERDILKLLVEGLSNKQIAYRMNIAENTVKKYLSTLFSKLGVNGRSEAIVLAIKNKLME